MTRLSLRGHWQPGQRSGATLAEILLALMVMAIGVTSIATMFPLSVIRAVQAHHLTSVRLLREQVEEASQAIPAFRPRKSIVLNQSLAANWQGGAVVGGRFNEFSRLQRLRETRVRVLDPIGFREYLDQGAPNDVFRNVYGNRGTGVVDTGFGARRIDGYPLNNGVNPTVLFGNANLTPGEAEQVGAMRDTWRTDLVEEVGTINAGRTIVTFPNSGLIRDALSTAVATLGAVGPNNPDVRVRLQISGFDNRRTEIREVTAAADVDVAARTVTFAPPLPNNGFYDTIGQVRIQTYDRQYSWIMTCRTRVLSGVPDLTTGEVQITQPIGVSTQRDMAIFFRRSFTPEAEFVYQTRVDRSPGASGDVVSIFWDDDDPNHPTPTIKEGVHALDPESGEWYQVRSVVEEEIDGTSGTNTFRQAGGFVPAVGAPVRRIVVQLDRPLTVAADLQRGFSRNEFQLMVLPEVIEVYPLPPIDDQF